MDYDIVAVQSFSSTYHFQRIFSILCGFTVGEYIRNRRLSLAGSELATTDIKVIDVAVKYGYESPDSFAKAFQKFHGITPSSARMNVSKLKSFSRLVLKISLEGGKLMNYRNTDPHCVITNITDEGYDYYYCHLLNDWERDNLYNKEVTGVDFIENLGLENIVIQKGTYVIKNAPELAGYHWQPESERNVQIWMPIEKIK